MPTSDSGESAAKPLSGGLLKENSARTLPEIKLRSDAGERSAGSDESLIGKTIDKRFRILSRLGKGGMSEVFKAEHLILQQMVALKVLLPLQEAKANSVDRFQQEAKAISSLDHPNIVKVYAFGLSDSNRLYLAMDFLDGKSLAEILEAEGALSWKRVANLSMQIADGLQHAHSRGIIHRDLKPSNIIIQIDKHGKETPKIVDFGIARLTSESGKEIKQLTLDGTTCGSPPYMSPEQCMGEPVDERSDIYSLGCMMYELLSGQRPFRANSRIEMMEKHVEQIPRMFRSVCPELQVPESLEAIVRTCLAKKLEQRYQNMSELLNDLKEIGSESVAENNLKQELKEELKKELEAFKKFRLKILQAWLMPIAGIALLGCAGFAIYKQLVPETKIEKFNNEFKAIKADDTNSIAKKVHLGLQIVELDAKTGNQTAALLMVKDLDKQVHQMAPSLARSQYLARIARSYLALGRNAESELLMNQVIAELEAHIERCNNLGDLAGLEPASMLVIKICRDIPDKRDHALGQYNRLISAYIHRGNNQKAERLCVDALAIIKATGRPPDIGEVTILQFLSVAQAKQGKMDLAEQSLLRAWKIVEKGWAEDSAVYQNCARKIFDLYASQGKSTEAEKFKSMLK